MKPFHIEHWSYLVLSYLVTGIECSTTWHDLPRHGLMCHVLNCPHECWT